MVNQTTLQTIHVYGGSLSEVLRWLPTFVAVQAWLLGSFYVLHSRLGITFGVNLALAGLYAVLFLGLRGKHREEVADR